MMTEALWLLLQPSTVLVILLSGMFGLFVGAVPGLTATMATALLVPLTFYMDPVPAIAAMVSASAMAIFAGDLPGALLRMPGTPASAAYVDLAHRMTRQGRAELALGVSLVASVFGGLVGAVVLTLAAPTLAEFALSFSSYEYFWLACLGLTCAAFVSGRDPLRGLVGLVLGLFAATIGLDPVSGVPRFTMGQVELTGGLGLVPVLIGMFAMSEILRGVTTLEPPVHVHQKPIGNVLHGLAPVLWRGRGPILRGSALGTMVGALPGVGADIAAWISFAISRRKHKAEGDLQEDAAAIGGATAANNASLGAAYVPATVFGIPGDSITAIVIGVLFMKGLTPGPTVFLYQPQLIYAVFFSFFVANLLLLPLGLAAIRLSRQILAVPREILMPAILLFCIVGAFAMTNTLYSVWVMLGMGVVAWLMEENGVPVAPFVLGMVLGPMIEETFLTSMMKADGELAAFFARPLAGTIGGLTLLVWASPVMLFLWRRLRGTSGVRHAS
ncbi:tripartite tricarboxylate transporter permease [Geminicoccaceae bacterium 1502E]|nr:tripartite tricarboxylate transporter permease [Geminicoccaceae bacterium 1502E]